MLDQSPSATRRCPLSRFVSNAIARWYLSETTSRSQNPKLEFGRVARGYQICARYVVRLRRLWRCWEVLQVLVGF